MVRPLYNPACFCFALDPARTILAFNLHELKRRAIWILTMIRHAGTLTHFVPGPESRSLNLLVPLDNRAQDVNGD